MIITMGIILSRSHLSVYLFTSREKKILVPKLRVSLKDFLQWKGWLIIP